MVHFNIFFEKELLKYDHEFLNTIRGGGYYFGYNREEYDENDFALFGDSEIDDHMLLDFVQEAGKYNLSVELIPDSRDDWKVALFIKGKMK